MINISTTDSMIVNVNKKDRSMEVCQRKEKIIKSKNNLLTDHNTTFHGIWEIRRYLANHGQER